MKLKAKSKMFTILAIPCLPVLLEMTGTVNFTGLCYLAFQNDITMYQMENKAEVKTKNIKNEAEIELRCIRKDENIILQKQKHRH